MSDRAQRRDAQAPSPADRDIVALYREHAERIQRYCLSQLSKNVADAEDAVQETFLRAAPQLANITGEPAAYLMAIAHNVCYDLRRATRRQPASLEDLTKPDHAPGPDAQAVSRSLLAHAWRLLDRRERALLAHTYAGFSYEEIADRAGLSAKAVSVGICRARKRVRRLAEGVAAAIALAGMRLFGRFLRRTSAASPGSLAVAASTGDQIGLLTATVVAAVLTGSLATTVPASLASARPQPNLPGSEPGRAVADPATAVTGLHGASDRSLGSYVTPAPGQGLSPLAGTTVPLLQPSKATPQDTYFDSMTASPSYNQDRTVFAAGWISSGCAQPECSALFVTHDGGATWTAIGAGYQHGAVLLAPDYSTSHVVFAATDASGLLRSNDDGLHFSSVLPVPGPAAVSPASTPGDPKVLIASTSGGGTVLYDGAGAPPQPGPVLPVGFMPSAVAFAGDAQHVVVAGVTTAAGTAGTPAVALCSATSCAVEAQFPNDYPPVAVAVSPTFGRDRLVAVATAEHLAVSRDGGATFGTPLAISGELSALALQPGSGLPNILLASLRGPGNPQAGDLSRSTDGGSTLGVLRTNLAAGTDIHVLLALPGGRLLAGVTAPIAANRFGLRCSTDDGTSWASFC